MLEPACGDGAFSLRIPECVAIEIDARHAPPGALTLDFFAYPESSGSTPSSATRPTYGSGHRRRNRGATSRRNCSTATPTFICSSSRSACATSTPGGELIFITPRDFLKATGAARLNTWLFDQGTITDFEELGDARVFDDVVPNCAIWRFEKGDLRRRTRFGWPAHESCARAGRRPPGRRASSWSAPASSCSRAASTACRFAERVLRSRSARSRGADEIFTNEELGNADFVCSKTAQTGELRRMIFDAPLPYLEQFKERLLARRVTRFDESNWWKWGRRHHVSERRAST